jgi:hypothetical protein
VGELEAVLVCGVECEVGRLSVVSVTEAKRLVVAGGGCSVRVVGWGEGFE